MRDLLKRLWNEEDGMGVIEVVIIAAILAVLAFAFRETIGKKARGLLNQFQAIGGTEDIGKEPSATP